jgi:hypothetical protein
MRKIFTLLVVAIVSLSFAATGFAVGTTYNGYPVVNILVNGNPVKSDVPAIIVDGRTLLPVRAVADALGYEVNYDNATNTVRIEKSLKPDTVGTVEYYYVESNVIKVPVKKYGYPYVVLDGEPYLALGVFVFYADYDGIKATVNIPGRRTIIIPKTQEYEKGIDGCVYQGRIMIKLSALGLKAVIQDDTLILEAID